VAVVVDLGVLGRRDLPHVLPRQPVAGAKAVVLALDDAVGSAPAVVMRVVVEPALVDQPQAGGVGEGFRDPHGTLALRAESSLSTRASSECTTSRMRASRSPTAADTLALRSASTAPACRLRCAWTQAQPRLVASRMRIRQMTPAAPRDIQMMGSMVVLSA